MARVLALVEGPTERNFGQRVLAPHLGSLGIEFHPRVVGKPGHKGGVGSGDRARRELLGLICQECGSVLTTMFDLYALPDSWPGRHEAREKELRCRDAACLVEASIEKAIRDEIGSTGPELRFIPYLSLHEYEAMLFSNPMVLAQVTGGADDAARFQQVLDECGECEQINDSPNTAPSKRILAIARGYVKTVDGITATQRIGIQTIRAKCPHFDAWLTRLESVKTG